MKSLPACTLGRASPHGRPPMHVAMSKVASPDNYAILGVSDNVDEAELRRVWRRLAIPMGIRDAR